MPNDWLKRDSQSLKSDDILSAYLLERTPGVKRLTFSNRAKERHYSAMNSSSSTNTSVVIPREGSWLPPFVELINDTAMCRQWSHQHKAMLAKNLPLHIFSVIISSTNICTNLFSYFIFSRFRTSSLLHRLLKCLSLCEVIFQFLFLIFTVVEEQLLAGSLTFSNLESLRWALSVYLFTVIPVLTACHIARNWIICLVSMYRFEVVCRAMAQRFLLFRRPENLTRIVLFIVAVSVIFSIPRAIERNTYVCPQSENANGTDDEFLVLALGGRAYRNRTYKVVYTLVLLFILQTGGPTICVCTLNLCLVAKLISRDKMNRFLRSGNYQTSTHLGDKTAKERRTTKSEGGPPASNRANSASKGGRMVIILCVCFFVCEMPSFLSKSLGATKIINKSASELLGIIANIATALDSSVNIFVYVFSNIEFRRELCILIGWKKCCLREDAGHLGGREGRETTAMIDRTACRQSLAAPVNQNVDRATSYSNIIPLNPINYDTECQ